MITIDNNKIRQQRHDNETKISINPPNKICGDKQKLINDSR